MKVIGIGNILRGDDGIGPAVIHALERDECNHTDFSVKDIATDSFSVLEELMTQEKILLIDAAEMNEEPGTVKMFKVNDISLSRIDGLMSLHGMTFSELYGMAKELGCSDEIFLIGVQPKSLDFGQTLSPEVKAAIDEIIKLIMKEVNYDA